MTRCRPGSADICSSRISTRWERRCAGRLRARTSILAVEAGEEILERLERAHFAVHGEGLAQGVADAGVDGGRGHLHEPPGGSMHHRFKSRIDLGHGGRTSALRASFIYCTSSTE